MTSNFKGFFEGHPTSPNQLPRSKARRDSRHWSASQATLGGKRLGLLALGLARWPDRYRCLICTSCLMTIRKGQIFVERKEAETWRATSRELQAEISNQGVRVAVRWWPNQVRQANETEKAMVLHVRVGLSHGITRIPCQDAGWILEGWNAMSRNQKRLGTASYFLSWLPGKKSVGIDTWSLKESVFKSMWNSNMIWMHRTTRIGSLSFQFYA